MSSSSAADTDHVVLIVWLGLIAPALVLNLFSLLVIGCDKTKLGLCLITSSLACRIGHVLVVIPLWAIVTLDARDWSKQVCLVFALTWFVFSLCDVLTSIVFLSYYTKNIAAINKQTGVRKIEVLSSVVVWTSAILLSCLPVYLANELIDFNITTETCYLSMFHWQLSIQIGTIGVSAVVLLTCLLLLVRLNSEVKALNQTHHIFCKIVELRQKTQHFIEKTTTTVTPTMNNQYTRTLERQNGSKRTATSTNMVSCTHANGGTSTSTNTSTSSKRTYETQLQLMARLESDKCRLVNYWNVKRQCAYVINLRHIRNVLNVTVGCSLLLNALPQLVCIF